MIVSIDTLRSMSEFNGESDESLQLKLDSIESLVRAYTNNNFQNRFVRFVCSSVDNQLTTDSDLMRFVSAGDTLQITQNPVNDGLYVCTSLDSGVIMLDKDVFDMPINIVTKVEYPTSIQQGVINLMIWEMTQRAKVGIKAETLSRHSVTYYDLDTSNQVMGYPSALLGFLQPYMKARF